MWPRADGMGGGPCANHLLPQPAVGDALMCLDICGCSFSVCRARAGLKPAPNTSLDPSITLDPGFPKRWRFSLRYRIYEIENQRTRGDV